jgi:hypothetical protein
MHVGQETFRTNNAQLDSIFAMVRREAGMKICRTNILFCNYIKIRKNDSTVCTSHPFSLNVSGTVWKILWKGFILRKPNSIWRSLLFLIKISYLHLKKLHWNKNLRIMKRYYISQLTNHLFIVRVGWWVGSEHLHIRSTDAHSHRSANKPGLVYILFI